MDYETFKARYNSIMDELYELLFQTNVPEDAWIDEFDAFNDSMLENIGEYMEY